MSSLRLERIRLTRVALLGPKMVSAGLGAAVSRTVVRLFASDGSQGLGEADGSPRTFRAARAICAGLIGIDPLDLNRLHRAGVDGGAGKVSKSIERAVFGAIENAAWDLLGRHLGTPLHDLLGGPRSKTVPAVLRLQVPTDSAADAARFVTHARDLVTEHRFAAITVAASGTDWTRDAAVLRALREAFGGAMRLALDGHSDYEIEDARRLGRAIADLHLDHLVDPVRGRRNLTKLRRALHMPVAAGAILNDDQDLASAVRAEAVDGILGNGTRWGGIVPFLDVAAICRTFGLDLGITDLPGIGISLAANLHLATVHPAVNRGLQVDAGRPGSPLLADWAPVVTDGHLTVPEGAGLGINLDHQALAEHVVDEAVLPSPRLDGGRR